MNKLILLLTSLLFSIYSYAQTKEIVYNDPNDSLINFYIAFKPTTPAKGLLLLLPSFGETPHVASNETEIHKVATGKGLITVYASLQYGPQTFCIDSLSQSNIEKLITELQKKYNVKDKPFYMGGFSIGGSGVVKYAERAYTSTSLPRPKAIFAIDPPLDFERLYNSMEYAVRQSKSEISVREAAYFIQRLQYEFQSTPQSDVKPFHIISPYSYSDTLEANIKPLISCPVMLISEPDITWQMEERNRNLYDLNTIDCSAVINSLKLRGNKNAVLVLTSNKGYRKLSGKRNPHSWSIADAEQTVNWLLKY